MVARRALKDALQRRRPDGRSRNGGRPDTGPVYTDEIAEEICDRLASGEPLAVICRDAHMPDEKAVRKWVQTRAETFGPMYARARDIGYDSIAERILELGEDRAECIGPDGYIDNGEIQRLRMLSDNRRWLLAKLRPKQYGDKVTQEITGEDGGALITRIELVPVAARPRLAIEHDSGGPAEARNSSGTKKRQKP
jgi:hypothetical protein